MKKSDLKYIFIAQLLSLELECSELDAAYMAKELVEEYDKWDVKISTNKTEYLVIELEDKTVINNYHKFPRQHNITRLKM